MYSYCSKLYIYIYIYIYIHDLLCISIDLYTDKLAPLTYIYILIFRNSLVKYSWRKNDKTGAKKSMTNSLFNIEARAFVVEMPASRYRSVILDKLRL